MENPNPLPEVEIESPPVLLTPDGNGPLSEFRKDYLLKLYDQLYSSINRYYTIVWQTVSVLIGVFGLLSLVEKKLISLDLATLFAVIIATWMTAHAIDGNFWLIRNITIVANIEQMFLNDGDEKLIHPYWSRHPRWQIEEYFQIQIFFGITVALLMVGHHFLSCVAPSFRWTGQWGDIDPAKVVVYLAAISAGVILFRFHTQRRSNLARFQESSPGYVAQRDADRKE